MKISTVYNGASIEGVVLKRSPVFIEVAITYPYQKLSTCKMLSSQERTGANPIQQQFDAECGLLLIELFQVGQRIRGKNNLELDRAAHAA